MLKVTPSDLIEFKLQDQLNRLKEKVDWDDVMEIQAVVNKIWRKHHPLEDIEIEEFASQDEDAPRRFIALDKTRKDSDGNENFSLVSIHKDGYPFCKNHGAMNKVNHEIWRCLSEYGYEKQEGQTMPKFKDRTCNACCVEPDKSESKGCGRKFYVRRHNDGYIIQTFGKNGSNDKSNYSKKVLLICGDNLSNKLCPECQDHLKSEVKRKHE